MCYAGERMFSMFPTQLIDHNLDGESCGCDSCSGRTSFPCHICPLWPICGRGMRKCAIGYILTFFVF